LFCPSVNLTAAPRIFPASTESLDGVGGAEADADALSSAVNNWSRPQQLSSKATLFGSGGSSKTLRQVQALPVCALTASDHKDDAVAGRTRQLLVLVGAGCGGVATTAAASGAVGAWTWAVPRDA
jgi:hypothetical protein